RIPRVAWRLREEGGVQCRDALRDHVARDEHEREHGQDAACPHGDRERPVLQSPSAAQPSSPDPFRRDHASACAIIGATVCWSPAMMAAVRRTTSRESAAISNAITIKRSARANRADRCNPPLEASRNSVAMTAGIVSPGWNNEAPM